MDMGIVNTVHKSNKNICLKSQEVNSIQKCTRVLAPRPSMVSEDLTLGDYIKLCIFREESHDKKFSCEKGFTLKTV
jgi:hypothetical protein